MKKQAYMKPTMRVVKIQQAQMICTSPGDNVMGPGAPNTPPSARQHDGCDDNDWND